MTVSEAGLAVLLLSALNGAVTTILTTSTVFEPLRGHLERLHPLLGELSGCHLCAGTWVGAGIAAVAVWRLGLTGSDAFLLGVVLTFATLYLGLVLRRLADV